MKKLNRPITEYVDDELRKNLHDDTLKSSVDGKKIAFNSWITLLSKSRVIHRDSQLNDLLLMHTPGVKDAQAIFEKRRVEFFDDNNKDHLKAIAPLPQNGKMFAIIFDTRREHIFVRKHAGGLFSLPELKHQNGVATIAGVSGSFLKKFRRVSFMDTKQGDVYLRAYYFFDVEDKDIIFNAGSFEWKIFTVATETKATATKEAKEIMSHATEFNLLAGVDCVDMKEYDAYPDLDNPEYY